LLFVEIPSFRYCGLSSVRIDSRTRTGLGIESSCEGAPLPNSTGFEHLKRNSALEGITNEE
jgi:hypothetical protein